MPCRDNRISHNRAQKTVGKCCGPSDCFILIVCGYVISTYTDRIGISSEQSTGHTSVASIIDAIETAVEAAIATAKHCERYVELRCLHCFLFSMRSKASAKLLDFQQIAKWLLKSGRKITTLLRSLFAYPRFLFYADGFLDQMLGASFDHCIPQTGVLKF